MFDLLLRSVSQNLKEICADFAHNWENPLKAVIIVSTIGSVVHSIAGKRLAILLTSSSVITIPFLRRQIVILEKCTFDQVTIGVLAVTAGQLCFTNPFLALNMISGIVLILLKWDNFSSAKLEKNHMNTVAKDQTLLKKLSGDIQARLGRIEEAFKTQLNKVGTPEAQATMKSLISPSEKPADTKETSIEEDLRQIKEKLTALETISHLLTESINFLNQKAQDVAQKLQGESQQAESDLIQRKAESAQRLGEAREKLARLGIDVEPESKQ